MTMQSTSRRDNMEDTYKNALLLETCIKEHLKIEDEKKQDILKKIITYNFLS